MAIACNRGGLLLHTGFGEDYPWGHVVTQVFKLKGDFFLHDSQKVVVGGYYPVYFKRAFGIDIGFFEIVCRDIYA